MEAIQLLLNYGTDIDLETKDGSIKELLSNMKESDRKFIVSFAGEVDLLDLYRQLSFLLPANC